MAYIVAQGTNDKGDRLGPRYCQDGIHRFHAPFGTEKNCARVYKKRHFAEKRAKELNRWATSKCWFVVDLEENEVDGAGNISEKESENAR